MKVMVVQMMDHKGALSAHDDHVALGALVGEPGPGHGAHEDHVLDVLEERIGHGLLELVQKLEEFLLRIGVDELERFERFDLRGNIVG